MKDHFVDVDFNNEPIGLTNNGVFYHQKCFELESKPTDSWYTIVADDEHWGNAEGLSTRSCRRCMRLGRGDSHFNACLASSLINEFQQHFL